MNPTVKWLKEHLESEEGRESIRRYAQKIYNKEMVRRRWVQKFKDRYENDLGTILEKLIAKYDSDEYVNREHKLGYEPRQPLFDLVWDYAQEYCKEYRGKKHLTPFTVGAYNIGSYVIQLLSGQGSYIRIDKK